MSQSLYIDIIKKAIYAPIANTPGLDPKTASRIMTEIRTEISSETKFSDLTRKHKNISKIGLAYASFEIMRQDDIKIPEKLKENYTKEWNDNDYTYASLNHIKLNSTLEDEIEKTSTIGELAKFLE
ncbi:hypothetical protein DND58_02495 [Pseudomonas syringae pv. pisi]|nr:hypothetical protein DND58_02495 [Pseudomonas syringae pv. pisi]